MRMFTVTFTRKGLALPYFPTSFKLGILSHRSSYRKQSSKLIMLTLKSTWDLVGGITRVEAKESQSTASKPEFKLLIMTKCDVGPQTLWELFYRWSPHSQEPAPTGRVRMSWESSRRDLGHTISARSQFPHPPKKKILDLSKRIPWSTEWVMMTVKVLCKLLHTVKIYKEPDGSQWLGLRDNLRGESIGPNSPQCSPCPGPTGGRQALLPWAETQFLSFIC